LGRRGLLLPRQLGSVAPIVLKALIFDKQLGNHSLGRNVRDAACYVCWSLARAFDAHHMAPYVNQIAGALLVATVFDREINCRRAASAAFQENVGRQGQFPHGIDIVTRCDYYAVGQIQNCYLGLSVYLAEFEEYRQMLIDHLCEFKFNHWDETVRELSAQALAALCRTCPDYMSFSILPKLIKQSTSMDLSTRHGALLCIGWLINALCAHSLLAFGQVSLRTGLERFFFADLLADLKTVVFDSLFEEKYFRGSTGEHMRIVVCLFIKKLVQAKFHVHFPHLFYFSSTDGAETSSSKFLGECEEFLTSSIEHNKASVQVAAVDALYYFAEVKYNSQNTVPGFAHKLDSMLASLRQTSKEYVRSGYCLAVGNFPSHLFLNGKLFFFFFFFFFFPHFYDFHN
jgi:hypothetical protein